MEQTPSLSTNSLTGLVIFLERSTVWIRTITETEANQPRPFQREIGRGYCDVGMESLCHH